MTIVLGFMLFSVTIIGAPVTGAVAISRIRRSNGQLTGLPFAAFGLLLYPLLILGCVTFGLMHLAQITIWTQLHSSATPNTSTHALAPSGFPGLSFMLLDSIAALVACFIAGRAAWWKIAGTPEPKTRKDTESVPLSQREVAVQTWWLARSNVTRRLLWVALSCFCMGCLFAFFLVSGVVDTDHNSHFEVGVLDPWLVIESNQGYGKRSVSGIFLAWSWLFGIGAYGSGWLLFKLKRVSVTSPSPSSGIRSISLWTAFAGVALLFLLMNLVRHGLFDSGPAKRASQVPVPVPPLGTITSGIGAEFTVPAGQVAVFEIVTRRDNETVPVPPHCGFVMAPADTPVAGTFRWSRQSEEGAAIDRGNLWSLEFVLSGGGRGHTEARLLPDELNAAVGARGLSLGVLEPNEEAIHWGSADANNLPANGLIGLRVTVMAHGQKTGGSGNAHINWQQQTTQSTSRRKLPGVAPKARAL
ncbi:MAG: hypothetical protein ACKV2Q_05405 [Planctomycetaceae bacterium]